MEIKLALAIASSLKEHRSDYEPHYGELADHFASRRGLFNTDPAGKERSDRGKRINRRVLDSTPLMALRVLKSGMQAGVSSPSRPWFRLTSASRDLRRLPSVRRWFSEVEAEARALLNASGLYNTLHTGYGDLGVYGTEAALISDDDVLGLRSLQLVPGSYWLGSDANNTIDTLYREYNCTVRQLVGKFVFRNGSKPDWTTVPPVVKNQFDKGDVSASHKVCHLITPRKDRVLGRSTPDQKPVASLYWIESSFLTGDAGSARYAMESGFDRSPISASRWDVEGVEVYGRSPGMEALPDVKELMAKRRDWAEMMMRANRPPMNAPVELRNSAFSLSAGAINFMADPSKGLQPAYAVSPPTEPMRSDLADTRDRIWSAMYADLFMMISNLDRRHITAREIDERHEEKLIAIGPVLERLQFEKFTPLLLRIVDRLIEVGLVPPPPDELQQDPLEIEYISLLAQAQRAVATGGVERLWAFAGNLAAAKPDVLDKLDGDKSIAEYADMLGTPPDLVLDDTRVMEMRAERAEQQNRIAQAEALAQAAPAFRDAAQGAAVLAEADKPRQTAPGDVLRRLGLQ